MFFFLKISGGTDMVHKELGFQIIGCCMEVHTQLGPGLLEQCYHNALYYELKEIGLYVVYNAPFNVIYKGNTVGEYYADLMVNNKVIIELKSVKQLSSVHSAQLINYLHISGCSLGLLVNFQGSSLEWQRLVV
jgi:GxxExxY protein